MRRGRRRTRGEGALGHDAINVTPLIDIVMVLIVFYLMVGSFIASDYEDVPLPLAVEGEPSAGADIFTINLIPEPASSRSGASRITIIVQGREMDAAALERTLRETIRRRPDTTVQLRAARTLPYRAVEPIVLATARAGATTLRLVTEDAR